RHAFGNGRVDHGNGGCSAYYRRRRHPPGHRDVVPRTPQAQRNEGARKRKSSEGRRDDGFGGWREVAADPLAEGSDVGQRRILGARVEVCAKVALSEGRHGAGGGKESGGR